MASTGRLTDLADPVEHDARIESVTREARARSN